MRLRLLTLFAAVLFCTIPAAAQTVNEAESSVAIDGQMAVVRLAVASDVDQAAVPASIELVDTADKVRSRATISTVAVRNGKQTLEFRLPIGDVLAQKTEDIAWYRLRYTIGTATGVVSLSQMIRDLFEMRIIAAEYLFTGTTYRVRVRATQPFTGQPAAGVQTEINVAFEAKGEGEKKVKLGGEAVTDAEGIAVVDLAIPVDAPLGTGSDGEIKVIGRKNGIVREGRQDLRTPGQNVTFLAMADKPIYQPEQVLNFRGILMVGAEAKTVQTDTEIEFRVTDEDDTVLYREKVRTSSFGIAAMSWQIPANAKLGQYRIEVRGREGEQIGSSGIRVSRYDLPNFAVDAKPDKAYYVPGENEANVDITANYLFGKPVSKGKVRVVEETGRQWNWKEQKYDINEGQVREGETDAAGKYSAILDLTEHHADLKDSDNRKYSDVHFAAYFTDLTSNKTEQRRFDIRVTQEPIHVYIVGREDSQNPTMPMNLYVTTFYADGKAAECDVEVKASLEDKDNFRNVGHLRTNEYAVGKLSMMRPKIGETDDDLDIAVIARDKNGRKGTATENRRFSDTDDAIQITTDRAIYKPGETMNVSIRSTIASGPVYVDVVSGWSVIDSRFAVLRNGRARLQIPYSDAFKGELKIAAFAENDTDEMVSAARGVIFPARRNIAVDASFDKAVYKPGEDATVKYSVVDAVGHAIESALGIVVLDKAVEERARTDAEFGGWWRGYSDWLGYGTSIGSVNVKDLNELDLSKPISDDLQLVAEAMLNDQYYDAKIFHSNNYFAEARSVFSSYTSKQFEPVSKALQDAYVKENYLHATDEASFNNIMVSRGVRVGELRDPWGTAYRAKYSIDKTRDILTVVSAGPDKKFDTADDFTAFSAGFEYFTPTGKAIDAAVKSYNARTGGFIRDEKTLLAELGVNQLLDRFGRPYQLVFDGDGRNLRVRVHSAGADGKLEKYIWYGDDFDVWTSKIDYFAGTEAKIAAVQRNVRPVPMNEAEFRASLKMGGIDFDAFRDGWGRPLYVTVDRRSRYSDRVTIETVRNYGDERTTERRIITPVTQEIIQFTIRSSGEDGKAGNYDDITLMQVVHVLSEQTKDDPKPVPVIKQVSYIAGGGSVAGVVTDATGAIIAGATVIATNSTTGIARSVVSGDSGHYLIANLDAGTYRIKVSARAFKDSIVDNIPVKANATATVNVTLQVGTVSEVVTVSADGFATVDTSESKTATSITAAKIDLLPKGVNFVSLLKLAPGMAATEKATSTPRLREYFPETLVWQPELVTDKNGKAELKFKMADNITTWKMYTIASTKNGKVGVAEKEITAFQAFFTDLDPPKFLTEGDEIYLPTQVRNYTEKRQKVDVTMDRAAWFTMLGAGRQQIEVDANGSKNAVFGFKAVTPVKNGKQRVTAIGQTDSDAIEKPVTVRPDGQEIVRTDSRFATGTQRMEIAYPANALPRTQRAELKIFPNLYSQVTDSVEGLLHRPYGCGEQTISSTYPNLMILKFVKPDAAIAKKARNFVQKGYERLLGYQVADGGFTYWGGKDTSDVALTAYAIRFLTDARTQIAVDEDVIKRASAWLIKQQRADGSWGKRYSWEAAEDTGRTKMITTYVARSLAMNQDADKAALRRALDYLKARNNEIDEPYAIALYGLAALDAGDRAGAEVAALRLEAMAQAEGDGVYWKLETNTPFYGWGTAGRIETTALVTQLLIRVAKETPTPRSAELIGKGTIFLLKNKDRYGVWYSTQTTINVLDAFLAAIGDAKTAAAQRLEITLNGQAFGTVDVPADQIEPVVLDLTGKLDAAANAIEIGTTGTAPLMTQTVTTHYIDWKDADLSGRTVNQSRALKLDYKCDKPTAAIMQEVNCSVRVERVGFQGYGMLLAEIGTPPGADVSRESLEKAIADDWSISRYDVLPDRIVIYMWSKVGGTSFNFKFKPRYAINAQTPSSIVYDYYNPEAQAVVAPLRFVVK